MSQRIIHYIASCAKWLVLSILVGLIVGPIGASFGLALRDANAARAAYPWLLFLLPFAGLAIVWAYRSANAGTGSINEVFDAVREQRLLPLLAAPLIYASTVITHLCGGSAGREGAALLMGGVVAGEFGRLLRLDARGRRSITLCGMSAGFAAVFGTPLAATVFALEVMDVGSMQYSALLPCLISALLGEWIAVQMKLPPTAYELQATLPPEPMQLVKVLLFGVLIGFLSAVFCLLMHQVAHRFQHALPNPYVRVVVGAVLVIAATLLLRTGDYNGAGESVIEAALDGHAVPWAFVLKMLFTAVTLGCGFKGGEIVPIFFTGATFGCVVGPLLGIPAPLGAALGMVALFCGCTNSPLASILLSIELFGSDCLPLFALACAASYLMSGYSSLYSRQKIIFSKLRTEFINRTAE